MSSQSRVFLSQSRAMSSQSRVLLSQSPEGDDRTQYKSALDLTEEKGWDDLYELIERTSLANKNIPMAVVDGDSKLTKSLPEQGADINTVTDTGESLLMREIRHGHREMSELLISQEIDVVYVLVVKILPKVDK
ncbi:uncharacterized protein LOC100375954, partial [Saccoglossus kowalevskii]